MKILLILYSFLDISSTLISLGFYSPGWNFDLPKAFEVFNVSNYSYWTSPLDFVILCLIRQFSLLSASCRSKNLRKLVLIYDILAIVGYMATVIKLLSFDESPEMMKCPGVYLSTGFSIFFSFSHIFVVKFGILKRNSGGYQSFNDVASDSEDSESQDSEDSEENDAVTKEEKSHRLPLSSHLWQILKLCGKQWKWFSVGYTFLVIECVFNLIEPALYGRLMTLAIQMKSFDLLKQTCFILFVAHFLEVTCRTAKYICMQYAKRLTAKNVRKSLFQSILYQDISFFDENKTGQLMSRITHDSESVSKSLPTYIETITWNIFLLFASAPIMFFYSWQLFFATFVTFPITLLVTKSYGLIVEQLAEQENDATAESNETVEEVLSAVRTVRSFASEKSEVLKYSKNTDDWLKISVKSAILGTCYTFFWESMWGIEDILIYLYGGYLTLNGRMAPESLIAYVFYNWKLHEALNAFSTLFSEVMKTIGSSRKVIHIINRIPETDYEIGSETPGIKGNIIFEDVEFAYPTRKSTNILNKLNLTIVPGKTIALVGSSGNGKSTLVSLIQQFYEPLSGKISIDGTPIQQIDHAYYHSKISLVAQEPSLFSGTIRDNILYGIEEIEEDEMVRVAKTANVHEFVMKMEKGYDTVCGEKGVQMSGGQKQRIAIARALIRNPSVLILDEATSALDMESEGMVQEALDKCSKDRTVIVIAHRLSTIRNAHRIAVIENGCVVEMGHHEELMKNMGGVYCRLVKRQMEMAIID